MKAMNKDGIRDIRDRIIESALPDVPFDGWRWEGVCEASRAAGYDVAMACAVFPEKMNDVLDHFADKADRAMLERLSQKFTESDIAAMRVRDRVRTALLARYEYLNPHKEAIRKALQYWAMPLRKARAAKIIWRTSDRIWLWAGDTATDYNRYTKRVLLSGVIASTTLAWLGDAGKDMEETKAFLDRRIENVMQLGRVSGKVKKKAA